MDTVQNQQAGATDGKDTEFQRTSHESTNLLEGAYEEWLAHAEELDELQTLIQKAHKKSYELQTLIQEAHKRSYVAMKTEHDSALKKVQAKYNAYDTTRNKARRTGNTGEPETVKKTHETTQRTVYHNRESLRRANVIGKALIAGTKRYLVARNSVVVISSDSEDSDDDRDTVSGSENNEDSANGSEDNKNSVNGSEDNKNSVNGSEDNKNNVNGSKDSEGTQNNNITA